LNLVDSSGWLEYLADGKNAGHFAAAIEKTDELLVSAVNIYEVYKKLVLEKNENVALQVVGLMHQAKVIEVSSSIAVQAARFSLEFKMPMADSLIYATARMNDAIVLTQDADFKGLEGVEYYKKM
jgi:uncharacterized protein with PIN domain